MFDYTVANAFSNDPLTGNPVAVFRDASRLTTETMQAIARQLQLSETVFLTGLDAPGPFAARIFTPVNELPFAGHPLIGAASVVARLTGTRQFSIRTQAFTVAVSAAPRAPNVTAVSIDVPPSPSVPFERTRELLRALRLERATLPVKLYDAGARHVLIGVRDLAELRALEPDHNALEAFEDMAVNCFAIHGSGVENRMFSPAYGVKEDAGTGSAVGPLLQHLIQHAGHDETKALTIAQGILLKRPCVMHGRLRRDAGHAPVVALGGDAVRFCEARLYLDPVSSGAWRARKLEAV